MSHDKQMLNYLLKLERQFDLVIKYNKDRDINDIFIKLKSLVNKVNDNKYSPIFHINMDDNLNVSVKLKRYSHNIGWESLYKFDRNIKDERNKYILASIINKI